MMRYLLIFTLGLFAVACTSETKEEVKDLNDILPDAERDYDQKDSIEIVESDTLEAYQSRFSELGILDSISVYDEDLFPDRFGPEETEKYTLNIDGEEIVFVKWKFSDSTRVTNALFNWLDCFGPTCVSVRVSEERNLQRNAFQVLANDTVLIYLESDTKVDAKIWDKYFEEKGYELDWGYRMEQSRNGRVRWFTYIDEEKEPLKNEAL